MDDAGVADFVERIGLLWSRFGANRTVGRTLGWLLVCEPPEQTASDLAEALCTSKAGVSTATRTLEAMGLIERIGVPGQRRIYYRLPVDAWDTTAQIRMRELSTLEDLAQAGRQALADEPQDRRARMDEFHRWAAWWRVTYEQACKDWHSARGRPGLGGAE
jgi:DNA-binding transcriptional regulator GbsR (MarR family)